MMMRIIRTLLFLLFGGLLATSCGLQEDTVPCETGDVRLEFRYTYNTEGVDRLQTSVGEVWLYVFDRRTELLLDIFQLPDEALSQGSVSSSLPVGEYTLVAWGTGLNSSSRSLQEMGFDHIHLADSQLSEPRDVEVGATMLDDFRLMLRDPSSFDELFFSMVESVSIRPFPETTPAISFDFVRYNNTLNVEVIGYHHLLPTRSGSDNPLEIYVTGQNGSYLYDGGIDSRSAVLRFDDFLRELDSERASVGVELLHLNQLHHTEDNPVLLHLEEEGTGAEMLPALDVLDLISRVRDANGNKVYRTQEDIDRESVFPIRIHISQDLRVTVTICDFTIEDLDPILGH